MKNFVSVPSDLYIHKSDMATIEAGGEVKGYVTVSNPSEYELVNRLAFQQGIRLDSNTYHVTFIFK